MRFRNSQECETGTEFDSVSVSSSKLLFIAQLQIQVEYLQGYQNSFQLNDHNFFQKGLGAKTCVANTAIMLQMLLSSVQNLCVQSTNTIIISNCNREKKIYSRHRYQQAGDDSEKPGDIVTHNSPENTNCNMNHIERNNKKVLNIIHTR